MSNDVLTKRSIRWKAKGLYMLLKDMGGVPLSSEKIARHSAESPHAIRSGLRELEKARLLKRKKMPNGTMIYEV